MSSTTERDDPKVDERKTRELCAQERNGLRCMRPKGHAHEHAAFTTKDTVTWE
jgi:hypothetical protein